MRVTLDELDDDDDDDDDDEPEPEPDPCRPFGVADAMILMAAVFIGLAWDRDRLLDPLRHLATGSGGLNGLFWRVARAASDVIEVFPPLLTVASLTVVGLRLRKPRPVWARLIRQPGFVATSVASLVMGPLCGAVLASHFWSGTPWPVAWARAVDDLQPENLTAVTIMISLGVWVSWVVLTLNRRLRAEPCWIDRLGRLTGVGWLLMLPGGILLALVRFAGQL